MTCNGTTIKQGNVGPIWRIGVPLIDADGVEQVGQFTTLNENYTCTIKVATASPVISRGVTARSADDKRFLAQLTSAETTSIPVGTHTVAIEVNNTTLNPPYKVEAHVVLKVEAQIIS